MFERSLDTAVGHRNVCVRSTFPSRLFERLPCVLLLGFTACVFEHAMIVTAVMTKTTRTVLNGLTIRELHGAYGETFAVPDAILNRPTNVRGAVRIMY